MPQTTTVSVPIDYDNLSIPAIGYAASVQYSTDPTTAQSIVDAVGSAWIGDYNGHTVIGDHAYQGFSSLNSLQSVPQPISPSAARCGH